MNSPKNLIDFSIESSKNIYNVVSKIHPDKVLDDHYQHLIDLVELATTFEKTLRTQLKSFHDELDENIKIIHDGTVEFDELCIDSTSNNDDLIEMSPKIQEFNRELEHAFSSSFSLFSSIFENNNLNQIQDKSFNNILKLFESITMITRVLRNVVSHRACQNAFGQSKPSNSVSLVTNCINWYNSIQNDHFNNVKMIKHKPAISGMIRSSIQFLSNSLTGNSSNQAFIWNLVFPKYLELVLNFDFEDYLLLSNVLMLVYNSISRDENRKRQLLEDDKLLLLLFQRYQYLLDNEKGEIEDEVSYWILLICKKLWSKTDLFFKSLENSKSNLKISKEQLLMLHMLDSHLEIWVESDPGIICSEIFVGSEIEMINFFVSIVDLFDPVTLCLNRIDKQLHKNLEKLDLNDMNDDRMKIETSWLVLQILANFSTVFDSRLKDRITKETGLIKFLIRLLAHSQLLPNETGLKKSENSNASNSVGSTATHPINHDDYRGLKAILMRIIANCCHLCKEIQDEIRNFEGIPLILNGCKDDDVNPFIREWSLFTCRNLCEGNEENQKVIAAMKLEGVIPSLELEKLGFKAILEESGKIRLEKIEINNDEAGIAREDVEVIYKEKPKSSQNQSNDS